jgi:hypothetical protein
MSTEFPEITSTYTPSRWIPTTEVAKLIRTVLKAQFPGVKFSVRSDKYSGGSAIDINWTDGPTQKSVDALTAVFAGARFDGMIDLAYSADQWLCAEHGVRVSHISGHSYAQEDPNGTGEGNGIASSRCCAEAELVHMGVSYVFAHRTLSEEFRDALRKVVLADSGMTEGDESTPLPQGSRHQYLPYDCVRDGINRLAQDLVR